MIFRVVERATGDPIAGAAVEVRDLEASRTYATDEGGVCRIELPASLPDGLGVFVEKRGFIPMRVVWELTARSASLPVDYTLALEPGTRIGGMVCDECDAPVEGVTVFLHLPTKPQDSSGEEKVSADLWEKTCFTDAAGHWHFDEAPADLSDVFFRLRHADFVEELRYKKADQPVGEFRQEAVVWRLEKGVRVEGVVLDCHEQPVAGAEILPGEDRVCSGAKPSFQTDAAGAFSISLSPQRQCSLAIKAEGHSPALLILPVTPGMSRLRIPLEPGRKLRARVVDATGAPVAGARIFADTWRGHRTLEWGTRADEMGRFEWASAPADEVKFSILQRGYRPAHFVPLTASEEEHEVVLRRPLRIHGTVTDGQTGKPIEHFRMIPGQVHANHRTHWAHQQAVAFSAGKYEWSCNDPTGRDWRHALRIEADGYRPAVSQIEDAGEESRVDFQLHPGSPANGRVLGPEGTPVENARVVIASGNTAQLNGDQLMAGHGNLELTSSRDGTFSFSAAESSFAVVAAHSLGFAIATAEAFARDSVIRLEPWGGLEITADGASPDEGSPPFHLQYADLPTDAQKIPWVTIHTAGKRRGDKRIVFEKLPPGKVFLGRFGQSDRGALSLVIESAKTLRLDFDRGEPNGGKSVPGVAVIKVIDESGQPVAGTTVACCGFRLKSDPGSHFATSLSMGGLEPLTTNSHGVVTVGYPPEPLPDRETESITVEVRHPEYCLRRLDHPVAGEALPIVLQRGAIVRATAHFEDGRSADPIYAQIVSTDRRAETEQEDWTMESGGLLVNHRIPPGQMRLRLACFPVGSGAHFSDVVEFMAEAGQPWECRLKLRPGSQFRGKLDDSVPRPVREGRVHVRVSDSLPDAAELLWWQGWADVQSDGTFVFDSLPAGEVELIALCDDFASQDPVIDRPHSARRPQRFPLDPHAGPVVVAMEPTGTVYVNMMDTEGEPLPGAQVCFYPNVLWAGRYSGLFAGAESKTEDLLRLDATRRAERLRTIGMSPRFHGVADQHGSATVPNLPAGKSHFTAFCQGYEMESSDGWGRGEVELRPGEARNVTVTMHKSERR
jgi:hypothetical protein